MAFSTEFVAKADEYQTIIQTMRTQSSTVFIPEGEWMCSLTATLSIPTTKSSWIELDGKRATVDKVDESSYSNADVGVVVPSFIGGRSISIQADLSRTMTLYAAKIGY